MFFWWCIKIQEYSVHSWNLWVIGYQYTTDSERKKSSVETQRILPNLLVYFLWQEILKNNWLNVGCFSTVLGASSVSAFAFLLGNPLAKCHLKKYDRALNDNTRQNLLRGKACYGKLCATFGFWKRNNKVVKTGHFGHLGLKKKKSPHKWRHHPGMMSQGR